MISHQLVPPGGWKYTDPDTKTTIIASNWDSLVRQVTTHRKNNGLNIGVPANAIAKQLEEKYPELTIR